MAHVVFLRGVNIGGHRVFRPAAVAKALQHLEVVNIGAAGTFVVRAHVTSTRIRDEFARALPFETDLAVCNGRDVRRLLSSDPFAGIPARPDTVRFASVVCGRQRLITDLPVTLPERGRWLVKVLAREGPFILGAYRRDMKTIQCLRTLDRMFGARVTSRSWSTIAAVGRALAQAPSPRKSG